MKPDTPSSATRTSAELRTEQGRTLAAPRLPAGPMAKALFLFMDVVYGRQPSLAKARVLEVIARVPYIAWEQVGYVAITHTHATPTFARDIHDEVQSARHQQDNELFHLLILEELLAQAGERQSFWRYRVVPQIAAWFYYHVSWLLYVVRPRLSHELNAQFEDHAEHEYMQLVKNHPEYDDQPWISAFEDDYGSFASVGDMLRQIALDERDHKDESLAKIESARFGSRTRR